MTIHDLKCWPGPFGAIARGTKCFEFRRDDRGFRVGDTLRLRMWNPVTEEYLGPICNVQVTYLLRGPDFGMPEGYCVMSLGVPSGDRATQS